MINKISECIVIWLIDKKAITGEERELYTYATFNYIFTLLPFSLLIPFCFIGKKVEKHLKYKDLGGLKKMKIDTAIKNCHTNGKEAAKQINGLKSDTETFEIGVKEVLDTYYEEEQLPTKEQKELESFVREIDDVAKEIVENYEEAALERENSENLPYETEKIMVSFPYGTDWETIETIVENEAVSYEVIDDGEYHIDESLPEQRKKRLEKLKDKKKDIVILAEVELEDTVERAEEQFEQYECVNYAASNLYLEADGNLGSGTYQVKTDDPRLNNSNYWNLNATNVSQAWKRFDDLKQTQDIYETWVAVIDNGVDMEHPDLKGILLRNLCVDVTQKNKKLSSCVPYQDKEGQYTGTHGTAVTGVLASQANNGIGGAGAASIGSSDRFRNKIKVMAIKCDRTVDEDRHITLAFLAKAIDQALVSGADVINISYSALKGDFTEDEFYMLQESVKNAIDFEITVVCAAGNDGKKTERYPAALPIPGVISVGAYNSHGNLTTYTNQSDTVDIVAPSGDSDANGKLIMTTAPTAMDTSGYKYSGGTSCATPQVTATVAMMLALNVYLTPAQIEQRLVKRAGKSLSGTVNTKRTFPTLDTGKAVSMTNYNP